MGAFDDPFFLMLGKRKTGSGVQSPLRTCVISMYLSHLPDWTQSHAKHCLPMEGELLFREASKVVNIKMAISMTYRGAERT